MGNDVIVNKQIVETAGHIDRKFEALIANLAKVGSTIKDFSRIVSRAREEGRNNLNALFGSNYEPFRALLRAAKTNQVPHPIWQACTEMIVQGSGIVGIPLQKIRQIVYEEIGERAMKDHIESFERIEWPTITPVFNTAQATGNGWPAAKNAYKAKIREQFNKATVAISTRINKSQNEALRNLLLDESKRTSDMLAECLQKGDKNLGDHVKRNKFGNDLSILHVHYENCAFGAFDGLYKILFLLSSEPVPLSPPPPYSALPGTATRQNKKQ